jgi:hypothetical protein
VATKISVTAELREFSLSGGVVVWAGEGELAYLKVTLHLAFLGEHGVPRWTADLKRLNWIHHLRFIGHWYDVLL